MTRLAPRRVGCSVASPSLDLGQVSTVTAHDAEHLELVSPSQPIGFNDDAMDRLTH